MKNRLVFFLAIVFGIITAVLVFDYLNDFKQALDDTDYVEIYVANQDISAKTALTSSMIALKKIPRQYMHSQEITDKDELVGKNLLVPVVAGESILESQVIGQDDSKEGLAYMVPVGKRALTIPVDEVSGIAGLIKPGDKVDIIGTIDIGEQQSKPYTLVVLQNIEILATGKKIDQVKTNSNTPVEIKTVTLAVSMDEAKPLMMASQRGVIRLMLRSPVDDSKGYTAPFGMDEFLQ